MPIGYWSEKGGGWGELVSRWKGALIQSKAHLSAGLNMTGNKGGEKTEG